MTVIFSKGASQGVKGRAAPGGFGRLATGVTQSLNAGDIMTTEPTAIRARAAAAGTRP
jgi:hypothetical protein